MGTGVEAGGGVGMGPGARKCGRLQQLGRQENRYSTRVSRRDQHCPHPDVSPFLTSRTEL